MSIAIVVRKVVASVAFVSALTLAPAPASAYVELDAGDLPATAESTIGTGPLKSIVGRLDFDLDTLLWDIDLFLIKIVDPALFSASTQPGDASVVVADPVLFLFDFDGRGVFMNDDISLSPPNLQARLPSGHASGPVIPDLYYLAIAWAFSDPQSGSGAIFPVYEQSLPTDGVYGPTGLGGADPLASWVPGGPPVFDLGGDYRIVLTGAVNALVPEPNPLALLALAALMAFVRRPPRAMIQGRRLDARDATR